MGSHFFYNMLQSFSRVLSQGTGEWVKGTSIRDLEVGSLLPSPTENQRVFWVWAFGFQVFEDGTFAKPFENSQQDL